MRYVSVCSGIEAASVAWEQLGWEPVAFSEIEPFPAAVLKHRWPGVPNHGDMTKHEQWNIPSGSVDLLVGGTPCQSFSVAGLRRGLDDPRGGLMLTFLKIAQRLRPRWVVWENVPGVLSSNGGRDFGSFLGALGELGYGWAYRVLDAQWFGVAQRRRRVFVVGHLGNRELAAKVLFESESVRRDSPPSREKRKGTSADAQAGIGISLPEREIVGCLSDGAHMGGGLTAKTHTAEELWQSQIAETLMATDHKGPGHNRDHNFIMEKKSHWDGSEVHPTLNQSFNTGAIGYSNQELFSQGGSGLVQSLYENHPNDSRVTGPHEVAPSCVSRFGTGGGNVPLVQEAIAFQESELRPTGKITEQSVCPTLKAGTKAGDTEPKVVAFEPGIAKREGSGS